MPTENSICIFIRINFLFYLFRIGFLIDFISGPVSAGFTSAAAIVIAMTQVKDLLGLNYGANKFMEVWDQLSIHFREISISDAALGFSCMFVLIALRVSICVGIRLVFIFFSQHLRQLVITIRNRKLKMYNLGRSIQRRRHRCRNFCRHYCGFCRRGVIFWLLWYAQLLFMYGKNIITWNHRLNCRVIWMALLFVA